MLQSQRVALLHRLTAIGAKEDNGLREENEPRGSHVKSWLFGAPLEG